MPELPEIEILRRSLLPLQGRQIRSVHLSALAPVETTTAGAIRKAFQPSSLQKITRWGKYLLLENDRGRFLVIHLGMSGQLRCYAQAKIPRETHTHMEIFFTDGSLLRYRDARRFGTLSLAGDPRGRDNSFLNRLGPDFFDEDLDEKIFIKNCRRHPGINLKTLTLHQGIAAGLGNIYACESLYRAHLDPRRLVKKTSDQELKRLLQAARDSLALGIKYGGVSMRDYLDGNGHRGVMKEFLQVYDREGMTTLDGRGMVKRIVQNARSTWFCPAVQK